VNPISKNDNEYTSNLNLGKYKIENILRKALATNAFVRII
jgi:hypothetical protein